MQQLTVVASFAVALVVSPLYAGGPSPHALSHSAPHPAVVRVTVPEQGGTAYGSGTLIDVREEYGLVLTNWHVVRDANGPIEVSFPCGFVSQARSLKVDSDWDLAALVVWRPPCEPVRLASRPPRPGDRLTICGYGAGNYRAVSGRCTQYYAPRLELPQDFVELDVEARQGDSGGPIFNDQGELAGVLFGAGRGTTLGSFQGRVKTFLASLAPDIGQNDAAPQVALKPKAATPATPVTLRSGNNCPDGVCCRSDNAAEDRIASDGSSGAGSKASPANQPNVSDASMDWPDWKSSLGWAAGGNETPESPSQTWPRFENDTPENVEIKTSVAASPEDVPPGSGNLFETIRNVLAVIGALALVLQVVRLAG